MSLPDEILAQCAIEYVSNDDDCNRFVKAVCAAFFETDLFTGPNVNADAIVAACRTEGTWRSLGHVHANAIAAAKGDELVLAGMTSSELSDAHGHVAIVVGEDGQPSGSVVVPICYAGSISPNARVARQRVSATFGVDAARTSRISYFARSPNATPQQPAVSRLVDSVRGLRIPSHDLPRIVLTGGEQEPIRAA